MQPHRPRRLTIAILATTTLVVSTYFAVEGLNLLMIRPEALVPEVYVPASFEVELQHPPTPTHAVKRILARNIFDSKQGPIAWDAPRSPESTARITTGEAEVQSAPERCDEGLRMVGSVVVGPHPDRSLAVLEADRQGKLLRVGDTFGEHTLLSVGASHAYVQRGEDTLCWVPLFLSAEERAKRRPQATAKRPVKKAKAKAKKQKAKPAFSKEELAQGIVHSGGDRYRISRDFFERAMQNAAGVARGVRMRPHQQDGRAVGVKVYNVRRDSVFYQMGLRSGDLLEVVNGHKLINPAAMLELYGTLRNQDAFSVAITRGPTRRTLSYVVQ